MAARYRDPWTGQFAREPEPMAPIKPPTWHRVVVRLPSVYKPRGPWRRCRDNALRDAMAAGLGHYDQREREVILPVPAEIETVVSIDQPED